MVKLIEADCPNCGAKLELPEKFDSALGINCKFCGGKIIISMDKVHVQEKKEKATCAMCLGKGTTSCLGTESQDVAGLIRSYEMFAESCLGTGKCHVLCFPEKSQGILNYCRDGKCAWCKGTGRILSRTCPFCEGTGDCRFCRGTGRCKFCNGRGVVTCRKCNGTGLTR